MGLASDDGLHGDLRYWPVPELVALDLPGGMGFVDALRAVWDTGDAAAPLDPRLPPVAKRILLDALRPTRIVAPTASSAHCPRASRSRRVTRWSWRLRGRRVSPRGRADPRRPWRPLPQATTAASDRPRPSHLACLPPAGPHRRAVGRDQVHRLRHTRSRSCPVSTPTRSRPGPVGSGDPRLAGLDRAATPRPLRLRLHPPRGSKPPAECPRTR